MFNVVELSNLNEFTLPLVNQCFELWEQTYTEILSANGEKLKPESFYNSRLLNVIEEDGKVQAFLLHNMYDLSATGVSRLSYFDPVNDLIKQKLINDGERIFSCEWVTVHPDLRARFSKIQIGDLIMGLAFKVFQQSHCTGAMGFSRMDNKADRMAENFGFQKLDVIPLHGIDCGVMLLKKENLKPHPYRKTQERIDQLFVEGKNFSNLIPNRLGVAS